MFDENLPMTFFITSDQSRLVKSDRVSELSNDIVVAMKCDGITQNWNIVIFCEVKFINN